MNAHGKDLMVEALAQLVRRQAETRCDCCGTYHPKVVTMEYVDQGDITYCEICPEQVAHHLEKGWRLA